MAAGSITRADDRFWFAYGQLYGYYGVLYAAAPISTAIIRERGLAPIWDTMQKQMRGAAEHPALIISNGSEDGWIMPTHLATMGFIPAASRSKLVEMRRSLIDSFDKRHVAIRVFRACFETAKRRAVRFLCGPERAAAERANGLKRRQ